jgi:Uma2 family endonuclease
MAALAELSRITTEGCLVLQDVDWDTYEDLLARFGDSHIFLTYDRGNLEIMAPSYRHDRSKSLIGRLIEAMAFELDIEIEPCGSPTVRRKSKGRGLEPDECYYVANIDKVWNVDGELDLEKLPVPDLAVEVEVPRSSIDRLSVYAGLGIPEIWRYDRQSRSIRFLLLTRAGKYEERQKSAAFPFLSSHDFQRFVNMRGKVKPNQLIQRFQDWVRRQQK